MEVGVWYRLLDTQIYVYNFYRGYAKFHHFHDTNGKEGILEVIGHIDQNAIQLYDTY